MIAPLAGGADGAHLKEKMFPVSDRQAALGMVLKNHGLIRSGIRALGVARGLPGAAGVDFLEIHKKE